jgi:hypothetical protein
MSTRWSDSARVEHVNVATPPSKSRMALASVSTCMTGSRVMLAWARVGSDPKSIRDRFTE